MREPDIFGLTRAAECRCDQRLAHDGIGAVRRCALRVFIHQPGEQRLIEASPIHADAHGLVVAERLLDHHRELRLALTAFADVAGTDPVFRKRLRAIRMIG